MSTSDSPDDVLSARGGMMAISPEAEKDVWIYRMVVGALGLAVLICILGLIGLAATGKSAPEGLVALGSAAVGALAGLLAPSPVR